MCLFKCNLNHFGGVPVSVLAPSGVDCGFKLRSGQCKDYEIGKNVFSSRHDINSPFGVKQ